MSPSTGATSSVRRGRQAALRALAQIADAVLLVLLAGLWPDAPSVRLAVAAPAPRPGTLSVVSVPPAQIYLGSRYLGLTPVRAASVPAGSHTLELRTPNGRVRTRRIHVSAGMSLKVRFRFPPPRRGRPGTLVVTSVPWAQVFLDGKSIGTTPIQGYRLASHSYLLELRASSGQRLKRIIWVEADRTYLVHHRFAPPGPARPQGPTGWLRVRSVPGSAVAVDGRRIGNTPILDHVLTVGVHQVKLTTADGRTHVRTLRIGRDQTTQFSYRFRPKPTPEQRPNMAFLRVVANREARVYVDGKAVGWTPLVDAPVRPGLRRITLRAGRHRRTYRLRFRAGFTRSISVRFPPERRRR